MTRATNYCSNKYLKVPLRWSYNCCHEIKISYWVVIYGPLWHYKTINKGKRQTKRAQCKWLFSSNKSVPVIGCLVCDKFLDVCNMKSLRFSWVKYKKNPTDFSFRGHIAKVTVLIFRVCCWTLNSNQPKECGCIMEFPLNHYNILI